MNRSLLLLAPILTACQPETQQNESRTKPANTAAEKAVPAVQVPSNDVTEEGGSATPSPTPIAAQRTLTEWQKAENRASCAPLAFTDDGGAAAVVRAASFAGGWAVAFDQPQARSLYGIAGTGVAIANTDEAVAEVRAQWPLQRSLGGKAGGLPEGAMAGYGVEGAAPYPGSNPGGTGLQSLAYVVIPGQTCLYNVWSKLGRRHLETLLDGLTLLPTG